MRLFFLINMLVITISGAVLFFLYQKSETIDSEQHNKLITALHNTASFDNQRSETVLRSLVSLNDNYDEIAQDLQQLQQSQQQWQSYQMQMVYEHSSDKEAEYKQQYIKKLLYRTELIEAFKTNHAVLSNSVRYLPVATDELQALVDAYKKEKNDKTVAVRLDKIIYSSYLLLADTLHYVQTPTETLANKIIQEIKTIAAQKSNIDNQDIQEQLDFITSHSEIIIQRKPIVDSLLNTLVAVVTKTNIQQLINSYNLLQAKQLEMKERYQLMLIAFSLVLLLSLLMMAIRLRKSHKSLDILNKELRHANENLEKNVAERTKKLSNALKELKQSQTQLIQAEKMSSLGQMIAGIAHEINTPLGYIKSNVEMINDMFVQIKKLLTEQDELMKLLMSDTTDAQVLEKKVLHLNELNQNIQEDEIVQGANELLSDSLEGIKDISELVTNLKNFSRLDLAKVTQTDLHQCLESTLSIAKNILKYKVVVKKAFSTIPKIACSPSQINQVFLNLLNNAAHAIEKKGIILIKTYVDDKYVHISFQDNGKGIPKDILPQIFNPFFTTKAIGEGTGMGLSISYKIIEQHHGHIKVVSKVGKGTKFVVSLPITMAN